MALSPGTLAGLSSVSWFYSSILGWVVKRFISSSYANMLSSYLHHAFSQRRRVQNGSAGGVSDLNDMDGSAVCSLPYHDALSPAAGLRRCWAWRGMDRFSSPLNGSAARSAVALAAWPWRWRGSAHRANGNSAAGGVGRGVCGKTWRQIAENRKRFYPVRFNATLLRFVPSWRMWHCAPLVVCARGLKRRVQAFHCRHFTFHPRVAGVAATALYNLFSYLAFRVSYYLRRACSPHFGPSWCPFYCGDDWATCAGWCVDRRQAISPFY